MEGSAGPGETHGSTDDSSVRLLAAFELARRYAQYREQIQRTSSDWKGQTHPFREKALRGIPTSWRNEPLEWLGFVPLHRSGRVGGLCVVERGVRTHVNIDPLELFSRLLALRPVGFYLAHNHPSGDLTPSMDDRLLSQSVGRVAREFGIRLLGHVVVSGSRDRWIVDSEAGDVE